MAQNQVRLFDGFEVQAEFLSFPGIKKAVALRKVVPEGQDPHTGDEVEVTLRFKLAPGKPPTSFDNEGVMGAVEETWVAVPIAASLNVNSYVSRDDIEALHQQAAAS